jgi:RNA polymerase sigma factor (sigma-70 family)
MSESLRQSRFATCVKPWNRPTTPAWSRIVVEQFKTTHWSVVLALHPDGSSEAHEALNLLCQTYWEPIYVYLRRRGYPPADASDLTQQFFAELLARNALSDLNPARGRFRSFLMASLKNFLSHHWERIGALKRGAGRPILSLDDPSNGLEASLEDHSAEAPDDAFDRHWTRTLLRETSARLQGEYIASGKALHYRLLAPFLPGGQPVESQAEIAELLGTTVPAVKSEVHRMRQRFGQYLRSEVARTVGDPGEIETELRHLISLYKE